MFAIRQAVSGDAASVATVMLEATRTAMPYLPDLYTDEQVLEWITNSVLPQAQVHVAELNGVLVGFLALRGDVLEHLYVHPTLSVKVSARSCLSTRSACGRPGSRCGYSRGTRPLAASTRSEG